MLISTVKIYFSSGGMRSDAIEMTVALNQRIRPLGHDTSSFIIALVVQIEFVSSYNNQKNYWQRVCTIVRMRLFHKNNTKNWPLPGFETVSFALEVQRYNPLRHGDCIHLEWGVVAERSCLPGVSSRMWVRITCVLEHIHLTIKNYPHPGVKWAPIVQNGID